MITCHDKYGDFASMACTIGEKCELYDEPDHCQAYRQYKLNQRKLRVELDTKQERLQ